MDGISVARQANKDMSTVMRQASEIYGVSIDSLQNVIPHPGSKRILSSVARRLQLDESALIHTLAETGNTSSSSIPLSIDLSWDKIPVKEPLGFFAFGAGFTSSATVAEKCQTTKS
jgi:3-oxoacyl-[acyl-carrier-protein] synthase III